MTNDESCGDHMRKVDIDLELDRVLPFDNLMISFGTSTETLNSEVSGSSSTTSHRRDSKNLGGIQYFEGIQSRHSSSIGREGALDTRRTSHVSLSSMSDDDLEVVSEDAKNIELDMWDPMGACHESTRNIKCADAETTLNGVPHFRGAICPFSDGNACFKGTRCPYEHHIDRSMLSRNPKMALPMEPVRVTHFSVLPNKVSGKLGAWFFGKVRCVNGINDFYVTPTNGIACECSKQDPNYTTKARDGIYTVEGLTKEMNAYFAKHGVKQSSSFSYLELAAVRIMYNGEMGYYRATALKSIVVDAEKQPEAVIHLFDIGHEMTVTLNEIYTLPKSFCSIPPLAYRCYLFGVSQLQPNVSGKAEEIFTEAVEGQEALFRIRKLPKFDEASDFGPTEPNPYDVDVYVWDSSLNQFNKVAKKLTENWYALPWKIGRGDEFDMIGHFLPSQCHGKTESSGCYLDNPAEFIRANYSASTAP